MAKAQMQANMQVRGDHSVTKIRDITETHKIVVKVVIILILSVFV